VMLSLGLSDFKSPDDKDGSHQYYTSFSVHCSSVLLHSKLRKEYLNASVTSLKFSVLIVS
jgi:hypothetical protein